MNVRPETGQGFQDRLQEYCRQNGYQPPVYNVLSDRRGGRTAWSTTVQVSNPSAGGVQTIQARWWYDGQHLNNAKEDAAEVALRILMGEGRPSAVPPRDARVPKPAAPAAAAAPEASAPVAPPPAS